MRIDVKPISRSCDDLRARSARFGSTARGSGSTLGLGSTWANSRESSIYPGTTSSLTMTFRKTSIID